MTFLAAWLLCVGAGDLVRPGGGLARRRGRALAVAVSGSTLALVWLLCGREVGRGLAVWGGLLVLALVWLLASARAVDGGTTSALDLGATSALDAGPSLAVPGRTHRPGRPLRPAVGRGLRILAVGSLAAGTVLALLANGAAPAPVGPLADAYGRLGLPSLRGIGLMRALVVAGALLVQVGTANVVVRLALDAAGARSEPGVLRGGRLVGPLERLFIVGLGLAGQVTAASIVIAAKGLLRFPELQKQGTAQQRIDVVTEYFVVGSFVSWLVALLGVCLARA